VPRLTENYCRQERNETLADVPRYGDGPPRVRFTHVLNPYRGKTEHERALQEVTFETIRMAARVAAPAVQVRCVCVTRPDELDIIPADFIAAGTLTRTVLDVGSFRVRRALPLVFDILDLGIGVIENPPEVADCEDFIIFTNMDIHLQPHFYIVVSEFIKEGYDIIDVHRRTIPNYPPSLHELPTMFAEPGVHHGGLDCIIFPRQKYTSFVKNNACVGMSLVMKGVLLNCAMQARRFLVLSNARLTFHIGNERAWAVPLFKEYEQFNLSEFHRVIRSVSQDKAAALRLISAFQAMAISPQFVSFIEEAAGIRTPRPKPHQVILRKIKSARGRLIRKAIDLVPRLGETAASEIRDEDGNEARRDRSQNL
jgi:hypothetical protein